MPDAPETTVIALNIFPQIRSVAEDARSSIHRAISVPPTIGHPYSLNMREAGTGYLSPFKTSAGGHFALDVFLKA